MPTPIESSAPNRLDQANLTPRSTVHPSPADWRDQTLYFLLPDRFSDNKESTRALFDPSNPTQFKTADKAAWMQAGNRFTGGTLKGIEDKLPYLKALGITALWVGPIFKQCASLETYHGYGIQNFLDVDPRFGTRQDLRDLVDAAHLLNMYVLLDIIYNHTGDVFYYNHNGQPASTLNYRFEPPYDVHGWRSNSSQSTQNPTTPGDAIQPQEFQNLNWFTRGGQIGKWDPEPWEDRQHPLNEFRRGDFFSLKNLDLSNDPLSAIIDVYRYWIALSDCDGFRIDTVKHVPLDVSRHFCGGIREYAETIGKSNFLLLGEVTGGSAMARDYLDVFGRNLDATLDFGEPAARLTGFVKGFQPAGDFFEIFGGHDQLGSHREVGRYHVSILDDHDMVGRTKRRFAAGNNTSTSHEQTAHAVGVQLTTIGIPCIYYGTEQSLNGSVDDHDKTIEPNLSFEDRYIREAMFGGPFGAFQTSGCHVFNSDHPTYLRIAAIARLRNQKDNVALTLSRGRSYLRDTATDGTNFSQPRQEQIAAWSRILFRTEVVIALNTSGDQTRSAHITIDAALHNNQTQLRVLYRSDWTDAQLKNPPTSETIPIETINDRRVVQVQLPSAGMLILSAV